VWIHCELEVQQNNMTGINSCIESWMCYFENLGYLLMESRNLYKLHVHFWKSLLLDCTPPNVSLNEHPAVLHTVISICWL